MITGQELQWDREYALEQTAGDAELLAELITLFVDSAAADLEALRQAVVDTNAPGVVRAAHSIKGAAATLGLETIRDLALAMEADGRADSVQYAAKHLVRLEGLLGQVTALEL